MHFPKSISSFKKYMGIVRNKLVICSCITFSLLFISSSLSYSASLVNESFEAGYGSFVSYYDGGSAIVTDGPTPLPTHSLRFIFPEGFLGGYAPDSVAAGFSPQNEIWGRVYVKVSPGFVYHPVAQKLFFIWGNDSTFNFVVGIGSWGNPSLYVAWQGDGRTWYGNSPYVQNNGTWYKLDFYMKMNSGAGIEDGIFKLWTNDILSINVSNVPYRGVGKPSGSGFHNLAFTPVYGGMGGSVPQTQYIWVDGAQISNNTLLESGPPPSASPVPSPPSDLRIN